MGQNLSHKSSYSAPGNPFQERLSEIHSDLFFLQVEQPESLSFRGYPLPQKPSPKTTTQGNRKPFTPSGKTTKENEKWVKKSRLDEISQSKWALFEKMVGQNFGDSLSKSVALSAFRSFLKRTHPDLSGAGASYDFATLVKVKDELVAVLDAAPAA